MTSDALLSSEVKRLLVGIAGHGNLHLTEIEADLVQTTYLLGEAIGKLGASFMAIHTAVCAQQELIDSLLSVCDAAGDATSEQSTKIRAIHNEIGLHVNSAVTGLQFQDMTSQLIGRTIKRVSGLRDVLAVLGKGGVTMMPESDKEELILLLNNINSMIESQNTKLESVLWKAVSQTHMESGDVELF